MTLAPGRRIPGRHCTWCAHTPHEGPCPVITDKESDDMTQIRMIPVDLIDPHPHNPRREHGGAACPLIPTHTHIGRTTP